MAKAAKRITADEAAGLVQSGMWLDYGAVLGQPDAFDEALAKRLGDVTNLRFRSVLTARPRAVLEADPETKHVHWFSTHFS
ncbi:MAG: 4-hydroxybutyrate CoA-transferase, partial [Pseudomonadota bacterium]